jgi:TolB protein
MLIALTFFAANIHAQDDTINIVKTTDINKFAGAMDPVPIAITGFSGEVAEVLNFDLTVMGFKAVPNSSTNFLLSGGNESSVHAQLSYGPTVLFSQAYSGGTTRAQAHRLADEVVLKLTSVKGIAETKIAFKANTDARGEIFISDFDGANPIAITRDNTQVAAPCWVPGRMALYYTSYKFGQPNIFYQNLSSGERRNFARYPGLNTGPAVSPDGNRVAMTLSKTGTQEIWECDANGSGLRQLSHAGEASSPCWSPNGEWVCYTARVGGRLSLFKVPAGGGQSQRIPTDGVSNPSEPDWSPDGRWIAFTAHMGEFALCVVPATGGSAVALVSGEDPSWAPNSRTLVFVKRNASGSRSLSLLDVPTKQVKDAHRVPGNYLVNSQPSWAR